MPNVIRIGDRTSHGGTVLVSGAPHITVDGLGVALVGDTFTCPVHGHTPCRIVEGNPHHLVDGIPVAYDGNKTSCGAVLVSSCVHFRDE